MMFVAAAFALAGGGHGPGRLLLQHLEEGVLAAVALVMRPASPTQLPRA